jgi:hypothetical protein
LVEASFGGTVSLACPRHEAGEIVRCIFERGTHRLRCLPCASRKLFVCATMCFAASAT